MASVQRIPPTLELPRYDLRALHCHIRPCAQTVNDQTAVFLKGTAPFIPQSSYA